MKCDEIETEQWLDYGGEPMPCYPAKDVDEAIEELKAEINRKEAVGNRWFERCMEARAENVRLKKKMDDYHLMSDIRRAKIKELKRALWLARALALSRFDVDEYLRKNTHCNSRFWNNGFNTFNEACKQMQKAINIAEAKCRAKAKELK